MLFIPIRMERTLIPIAVLPIWTELCARVVSEKADIGIAFDGDADRMLAVDENGKLVDGDQIMAICGNFLKENGKLAKDTIVVTVMTNLGFSLMGENREFMWRKQKSETVMFLKICWKTDIISEESSPVM